MDTNLAEEISLTLIMFPLPMGRAYSLVKDVHIYSRILIEKQYQAICLDTLDSALYLICP
jgi:hypothetical protein